MVAIDGQFKIEGQLQTKYGEIIVTNVNFAQYLGDALNRPNINGLTITTGADKQGSYTLPTITLRGSVLQKFVGFELKPKPDMTANELFALFLIVIDKVEGNALAYALESGLARHLEEIKVT